MAWWCKSQGISGSFSIIFHFPKVFRIWVQGSKLHSSDRLRQVKMTVRHVEYLQDLSEGRLRISDFHISCIGLIYFRQVKVHSDKWFLQSTCPTDKCNQFEISKPGVEKVAVLISILKILISKEMWKKLLVQTQSCCPWMEGLASVFNKLRLGQNVHHFPDNIFKCIFLNENIWISIKISLKFVLKSPNDDIPALVQIMARHRPGDKPLSEPMMVSLLTHILNEPHTFRFNSLWPSDAILTAFKILALVQVMACCLTVSSHYLDQCWLIIIYILWHLPVDVSLML